MKVLRKILGVFLLVLSLYLAFAFLITIPENLAKITPKAGPERYGQIAGTIFFSLLVLWLIYFLAKKGIKLLKDKPQSEIEDIGQR